MMMAAARNPFGWLIGAIASLPEPKPAPPHDPPAPRRGESKASPQLRERVAALAPITPPCFHDRLSWLEYVASAASVKRAPTPEPLPIVFEAGKPVRFNMGFNFCADCTYSARDLEQLRARNLCRPRWLLDGCKESLDAAAT
jgi:hypothetical protein